jgi:hypothetical protein
MSKFLSKLPFLCAAAPALLLAAACQASAPSADGEKAKAKAEVATPAARGDRSPVAKKAPLVVVHRSPTCGCCMKWVDHLRAAGYTVEVQESNEMAAVKERIGVPKAQRSCHTAEVAGYFLEGHVPAEDLQRLLDERPKARGLAVPGMPMGSPGMETADGSVPAYDTLLVANDGSTQVFAVHGDAAVADEHAGHDAHDH